MKLSSDSFRDLTSAMGATVQADHGERRRSTRVDVQTRVPMSLIENGQHLEAAQILVKDVSPRGINILYPKLLAAGRQFTVQLGGFKGFKMLCTVMHTKTLTNGLFSIGAEFTCVLPQATATTNSGNAEQDRIRKSMLE